jgi:L-ascorbate metabolism protein UlaG (beta-lactamase superfamily)
VTIRAQQVQHWGARTFLDRHRGFNAYLLQSGEKRIFYGADTALCDFFRNIGRVDLGIFGISAYNPFIQSHATPEQVWQMASELPADWILPMHHSTFQLSHEPMEEPMQRLLAAAGPQADRIVARRPGDKWTWPRF